MTRHLNSRVATLLLLALALCLPLSPHAEERDPMTHFFDQSLGNFAEELEAARDQGKQGVLLMFEQEECPFCRRMKTTVLNRAEVQEFFKEHFLVFMVDIEGDVEITDFQGRPVAEKDFAFRQFRVRATPVFAFIDLNSEMVARYTGATRDAEEFMQLGRYVVDGAYRETSFTRYKREQDGGRKP